ncbi:MAG: precorrin-8X methylmutase, partial [Treponema sp.]|nr:precorrin-8X methylmutase [Treponema sp.]
GYGGEAHCFISDDDVAASAKAQGVTRAQAAVDKALSLSKPLVFVVGNTPTALLRIHALVSSRTRMVTDTLTLLRPNGLTRVPLFHFTPHSLHSSLQRLS